MEELTSFAVFLKQYGAYAMASVFMVLYGMERRERRTTQGKYETYLETAPAQLREFADAHSVAVENLERAFIRAGIDTELPELPDDEDDGEIDDA